MRFVSKVVDVLLPLFNGRREFSVVTGVLGLK